MMKRPLLTVEQTATYLAVSIETVRRLLRTGRLAGIKVGSGAKAEWRVREEDLQTFLSAARHVGTARKGADA